MLTLMIQKAMDLSDWGDVLSFSEPILEEIENIFFPQANVQTVLWAMLIRGMSVQASVIWVHPQLCMSSVLSEAAVSLLTQV